MATDIKGAARTTLVKAWQIHSEVKALWDANIATAVDTEASARSSADTALQTELDNTQIGAGLGADGAYTADATSDYITTATSLTNADSLLDDQIKANADAITSEASARSSADTALAGDITAIESGFNSLAKILAADPANVGTFKAEHDLLSGTTGKVVAAESVSVFVNGLLMAPTLDPLDPLDYTITDNTATTGDYTVKVAGLADDEYVQMKWLLINT